MSYNKQTRISQKTVQKNIQYCSHCPFFFPESSVSAGNSGKRAHLSRCHAKFPLPSCPQTHDEVRRRKEQIVAEQVLLEAAISRPARLGQTLHDEEWILHLAANGRFLVLDLPVPIRSFVFFHHVVLRGSFDNAVLHV